MGDNPKEYPIYKYVKYPIDPFTIDPNFRPGTSKHRYGVITCYNPNKWPKMNG